MANKEDKPHDAAEGSVPSPAPIAPPASKIRTDWYQNDNAVIISVFIKNLKESDVSVDLHPRSLAVSVKLPTGSDAVVDFDPLSHEIDVEGSQWKVWSTKVEFTLKKKDVGIKWGKLEGEEVVQAQAAPSHAYPSSSRRAPKNWDSLASTALEEATKDEDPKLGSGDPNEFFKMLFKDADDDTKKAMMKSYQESGGTALSTNWADVKKGKVEVKPPEGMEPKQWGR